MESTKPSMFLTLVAFPLAGMAASLASMFVSMRILRPMANPFGSLLFGIAIAMCFWLFLGIRSIAKTVVFVVASIAAAFLAVYSGVLVTGKVFPPGEPYRGATFVGGFVGAFVVVATALFLSSARAKVFHIALQAALWSLIGGALGLMGDASGGWFRRVRSHFPLMSAGQQQDSLLGAWTDSDLALMLFWQTGMGLIIALALLVERKRSEDDRADVSRRR